MKKLQEDNLRRNQFKLILIVLVILFVLFFSFTLFWCVNYYTRYSYFNKVKAEVVDHEVVDGIEYDVLEYYINGNKFRITTDYESKNHIEDVITIYYADNNPVGVIYKLDNKRILLPLVTLLFGLATLGLWIVYYKNYLKGRQKLRHPKKINLNNDKIQNDKYEINSDITIDDKEIVEKVNLEDIKKSNKSYAVKVKAKNNLKNNIKTSKNIRLSKSINKNLKK